MVQAKCPRTGLNKVVFLLILELNALLDMDFLGPRYW